MKMLVFPYQIPTPLNYNPINKSCIGFSFQKTNPEPFSRKIDKAQDFHALAEVWLDGAWHMVDATGMSTPQSTVRIGVGQDSADVAFLTSFGIVDFMAQSVLVKQAQ